MQHVACPPMTTQDPERLTEEFPKWLEKVSSRLPGGIVLVIDVVDCCQVSNSTVVVFFLSLIIDLKTVTSSSASDGTTLARLVIAAVCTCQ